MKVGLKINTSYIPIYFLVGSLFVGSFIVQYAALALVCLLFFLQRPVISITTNSLLAFIIVSFAFVSYLYNLFFGWTDSYSILFWLVSYFPPFLLMWLILSYRRELDFLKIYNFYKKFVYLESFLLVISAFQHRTFVVGDYATGTIGDANWVAYHICVVILYEATRITLQYRANSFSLKKDLRAVAELIYFLTVVIIPESTANLGILAIVMGIFFFNEFIISRINLSRIVLFGLCACVAVYLASGTIVATRFEHMASDLRKMNVDNNYNLFKLKTYRDIADLDIYSTGNLGSILVGLGPATFTSRSAVVRMPEERVNDFPFDLPYFKSKAFAIFISPAYANWRSTGESYGNFASPQATVISVAVELGVIGLLLFAAYFYLISKALSVRRLAAEKLYLLKFAKWFTLFFVLSLFHLDFWEYPIASFTYILFVFTILKMNQTSAVMGKKGP